MVKDYVPYSYIKDEEDNFIPNYRQNEIYCDLANVDQSSTCKEKGAGEQYRKISTKIYCKILENKVY